MGWQDCLEDEGARLVIPWLGGRRIYKEGRAWRVLEELPREYGWYEWGCQGRVALCLGRHEADLDYVAAAFCGVKRGYLVGNRMVVDGLGWGVSPDDLLKHTISVFLVEPGLDRFTRAEVGFLEIDQPFYRHEIFPLGPEDDVRRAFVDRLDNINHIADVTPALDIAFTVATRQRAVVEARRAELERAREVERRREEMAQSVGSRLDIAFTVATRQRAVVEARRAELERAREVERRREEMAQSVGSSVGRRVIAATDFEAAARSALAVSEAELLDARQGRGEREMVVQYLFQSQRFECVVQRDTLRVVDSGICLTDSDTGEKGDTYFTLESLPGVVRQAVQEGELHIYRHVD